MLTTAELGPRARRSFDPAIEAPIAKRLREETRAEHEAIERNSRLSRLSAPDLAVEEYVGILTRLARFMGPVEERLRRWSACFPASLELALRLTKTELLKRDIEALTSDPAAALAPASMPFEGFANLESAWGCLYVLEGSTLGGQILCKLLNAHLGLTAERGTAFYTSYGPATGARWQAFKAALNACVSQDGLDGAQIIEGARTTFRDLNAWMAGEP